MSEAAGPRPPADCAWLSVDEVFTLCKLRLNGAQWRILVVLLIVMRGRLGRDRIDVSSAKIAAAIGLDESHVRRELSRLEAAGIITTLRRGARGRPQTFAFNSDRLEWWGDPPARLS